MAVLTALSEAAARDLVAAYGLGELRSFSGIPEGSVNSNFSLITDAGRVFCRIYEEQDRSGAERETVMLGRLASGGVPTPAPLQRKDGALLGTVAGKPVALFPWRDGAMRCQAGVTAADTRRLGASLARVHVAGKDEVAVLGRFGLPELLLRLDRIAASGHAELAPLAPGLRDKLLRIHDARTPGLPSGLMHGDLFRDNVLWNERGEIAALLDFESACHGTYAYDLMVCVLSWCFGDGLDQALMRALCEGYETVRKLDAGERASLHAEGSFAALRFTITRITDYALRADHTGPRVVKDYRRFRARFEALTGLGSSGLQQAMGW